MRTFYQPLSGLLLDRMTLYSFYIYTGVKFHSGHLTVMAFKMLHSSVTCQPIRIKTFVLDNEILGQIIHKYNSKQISRNRAKQVDFLKTDGLST